MFSFSGGPWHHTLLTMLLKPSDIRTVVCDVCACVQACSGPDVGVLVGAILFVLVLLWCVYCVVARENQAKKMDSFAFVSIVCSQFVTLFQMLGVLNTLSVAWPEPFAAIVEMGSLMNFRLEVLNMGCILSTPPLQRYVANAFAFVVLTLCMVACHFLHVMVFHFAQFRRARLRQFTPALFGAVGTVFNAVYISVCSAVVQPLQCNVHPNGQSTMQAYRQVICWDPEGDHQNMLIIGALGESHSIGFLLPLCMGYFLFAEAIAQGRHCVLEHVCLLALPIPSGGRELRAGGASAKFRLGSGASD